MSVEKAIKALLDADSGVGAECGDRIYPSLLPEDETLPAISYFRVSTVRDPKMGADSIVVQSRIQVDCHASSYSGAKDLRDAVRSAVQRYSGTSGGVVVQQIFIEGERDDFEPKNKTHTVSLDLRVFYEE